MGRDKDIQFLERDDAPRLDQPDQKFILPRTLNSLYTLGEVHVGCNYRGFIRVIFLQIEEKRYVEHERKLTIYRVVLSPIITEQHDIEKVIAN
jgi:hypothetical protein